MAGKNQIKYTVTGGLGFIGSHVVDGLLAAGHRVEIIDSTVAAVTDGREYDAHPNCTVHRESIQDYFAAGRGFHGIDVVIHAASHVGPAGILQYQGKLGNEKFVANAKPELVEAEREKQAELTQQLASLEAALVRLSEI